MVKMKRYLITICLILISTSIAIAETQKSSEITLIYIDDDTLDAYGSYPFTRDKYGIFINKIFGKYLPKLLYFDIIIDLPSKETPELDEELFKSIKDKSNIVFCSTVADKKVDSSLYKGHVQSSLLQKYQKLTKGKGAFMPQKGIIDNGGKYSISSLAIDNEKMFNKFPTIYKINTNYYLSTPIYLALMNFSVNPDSIIQGDLMSIRGNIIETNKHGQFDINFEYSFNTFSFIDVIQQNIDKKYINDKIVFIGINATGTGDYLPTKKSLRTHGLELCACATQTIIDKIK